MDKNVLDSPFQSDAFSSAFKSDVFGDVFKKKSVQLDSTEALQSLADQAGYEDRKPTVIRTVERVGRALNWDIANISGMALGMMKDNMSIMEGREYGVAHNTGFADVYKEMFGKPTTNLGKFAIGAAGFVSDILFSPLTYLTFGVGGYLKAGRAVTKGGSALFDVAEKEFISHAETLAAEGMGEESAKKVAMYQAKQDINTFMQRALRDSKNGTLDEKNYADLIERGLSSGTVEQLMNMGGSIIDQGGVKMFGKTLISNERLASTAVGKAVKKIGELETVKLLTDSLGKAFVADFGKNPKLLEIANRSTIAAKRAFKDIVHEFDNVFRDVSDEDAIKLFDEGIKKREAEYKLEEKVRNDAIAQYHDAFPSDGLIKNREDAIRLFNNIDDEAVAKISKIRQKVDDVVAPYFEERQSRIVSGQSVGGTSDALQAGQPIKGFEKIDALSAQLRKLQSELKDIAKSKPAKKLGQATDEFGNPITREEVIQAGNKMLGYEEERLSEEIDKIATKIEKARQNPGVSSVGADTSIPKLTPQEAIVYAEREIKKIQETLSKKDDMLNRILNARKIARKMGDDVKIEFKDNKKLQEIADYLWNSKDSFTKRLAKLAGVPEDEAYKFYIRPYYDEYVTVKKAAMGRNMSPFGKVKDDFTKMWQPTVREDIRKNPAESFKRSAVEVANARIKSNGIKAIYRAFDKQSAGKTDAEMEALGFVKYEKKILGEKLSGWIPKAIKKDVENFAEPRVSGIDELARNTGFDWATNIMKSWATSLFPAFHVLNITSNQFQLMVKLGLDWLNPKTTYNTTMMTFAVALNRDGLVRKTMGLTKEWEKKFMAEKFMTKNGDVWTNKKLINEIKKHSDLLDQGIFGDYEQGLTEVGRMTNWNPASLNFVALHHGRELGNFGEVQAKLMAIQSGIMNGKTIKQSIKDAEDAIFNYSKLSQFEREYMKRIIPFYTFARKNFEFQLQSLLSNPGRVATQFKLFNNINSSFGNSMQKDRETGLPNFVLDKLGISAGRNQFGQAQYITGFGLPIEEFLSRFSGEKGFIWNTVSNVLGQANPLVKYPIEMATGVDLYKGKQITEIDNGEGVRGFIDALGGPNKGVGKEFADLIGYREVKNQPRYINGVQVGTYTKYIADPYALHFFRNLPTARLQRTIQSGANESPEDYALRSMLGVNTFTIDVQREEFFKDLAKQKELANWLDRAGIISTKEIYFIPSEDGKKKKKQQ